MADFNDHSQSSTANRHLPETRKIKGILKIEILTLY
jgi:hypothetical protein